MANKTEPRFRSELVTEIMSCWPPFDKRLAVAIPLAIIPELIPHAVDLLIVKLTLNTFFPDERGRMEPL